MKPLGIYLQYHRQIGGIGSKEKDSLYFSGLFPYKQGKDADEGNQQAGGKVKGDGGRCHRKRFPGSQG